MNSSNDMEKTCVEIVFEKINEKENFTAYDITLELRKNGFWVEHEDVKKLVHALMQDEMNSGTNYQKNLEFVTAEKQAFVYKPIENDIDVTVEDYIDDDDDDDDGNNGNGELFKTDKRGRLCIPASMVRAIGLNPGDLCCCFIDPKNQNILSITNVDYSADGTIMAYYIVDSYNNIRISSKVLQKSIGEKNLFIMELNGQKDEINIMNYNKITTTFLNKITSL